MKKRCTNCKTIKKASEFHKNRANPGGLHQHCRECRREYNKKNNQINYDRHKKWVQENPDRAREHWRRWRQRNPDKLRIKNRRNKIARRKAVVGTFSENIEDLLFVRQKGRCFYCKKKVTQLELEHMVPISRGGKHTDSNLCLACGDCNRRKYTKTASEFLQERAHGRTN